MECWQTVEFWIGVAAGIIASLTFWVWSTWIYSQGRKSTEDLEAEGRMYEDLLNLIAKTCPTCDQAESCPLGQLFKLKGCPVVRTVAHVVQVEAEG